MVYEEVTEPSRAPAALAPEAARLEKPSKSIMLDLSELSPASKSKSKNEKPARQKSPKSPAAERSPSGSPTQGLRKLFVLDTNVLLHDPSSLFRFEEHDVFLPMMTLEELDHQKKGMTEVARNARQVSRSLDTLVGEHRDLDLGLPLDSLGHKDAVGRLFFQTTAIANTLPPDLPMGKADNQILGVVRALHDKFIDREVVLVSKDINMRLKARTLSLSAEDYFNDQVLEDSDLLYSGMLALPDNFWNKHGKGV
jgi:PhoH-like ATPase